MDFKPFLSGVLSFLFFFFNKNAYVWIDVNQAADYGAQVVLAWLYKEGVQLLRIF